MVVMTPPPTPPSPTGSVYDMSDDEEGEYSTIKHSKSGRGVKLLYSKSKVYVHPSPSSKDNIPGFIALVQQKPASSLDRPSSSSSSKRTPQETPSSSLLLAWVPESSLPSSAYDAYVKVDLSESSEPPTQSYLVPPPPTSSSATSSALGTYAFATPVSDIYSLLVRPPSIGWWYGSVVINTRAGGSFPALFFHDSECQSTILQRKRKQKESFDPFGEAGGMFWGGDEVLRWFRRYVTVERSEHDMNVYLIEPTDEDRLGFGTKKADVAPGSSKKQQQKRDSKRDAPDAAMDPLTKTLKEARWGLLEKFSQVTTFARRTAQNIVEHPNMPPQARRLIQNPEVQTIQDEFDSARLYLARWAMGIAEQSEKERRQRIWTAKDVLEMEETPVGDFEILDMEAGNLSLTDRRRPVTIKEWEGYFDPESGQLRVTIDEVKERIFHGGLDPEDGVRQEAWLFLLGVYEWDSTTESRQAHMHYLRDEYIRLKGSWWERLADPEPDSSDELSSKVLDSTPQLQPTRAYQKEQRLRIEKDVHRTDRHIPIFAGEDIPHPDPDSPFAETGTNVHLEQMKDMLLTYNEYNRTLGYVQGMSDLLAPIYAVCQDDAVAFWGFVGFMKRMERNFLRSQKGMRVQLLTLDHLVQLMDPALYEHLAKVDSTNFFFFFRMLLVWYKREFGWDDVLRLWETLWTDYMSSGFHLFIALAILEKHRDVIMEHLRGFDEVLKYVNDLSQNIDLPSTLARAESLFRRFERTVEAVDRKSHFPAPSTDASVRQRTSSSSNATQSSDRRHSKAGSRTDIQRVEDARRAGREAEDANVSQSSARSDGRLKGMQRLNEADNADVVGKVISPELRSLLSREVPVMEEEEIRAEGGGVGT